MSPVVQTDGQNGSQPTGIDPISRQILQRAHTQHRIPQAYSVTGTSNPAPEQVEDSQLPSQPTVADDLEQIERVNSITSNKLHKDKKKGVSFLSRIIGGKKREGNGDPADSESEVFENRPLGTDAEVFSQPIGYIPKFPAPPRYIRVKSQNRKKRDLDRVFLAQIISESSKPRSRKESEDVDAKIHAIDAIPENPPPNSSKRVNNAIWAAEFSRDGQYLATAGQDKKVRVWRVISNKEDREAQEKENSTEGGEKMRLNAPVFKQELVREYDGHTSAVLDLSWSKNNFLLSSSMDKTVRLYHISRPECLCAFKHSDFVTSIQFHPRDDRFFLAGSLDSKIRLWSIPDKNVAYMAQVSDMVTAVAFTPDGKTSIAGTLSGLCIIYDTEGLRPHSQIHVRSNRGKNAKGSKITGIDTLSVARAVGPPDVKLLITSNDSRVRMYNLRDRALEVKFRGNENSSSQIRASFSDDGKFVICGSEDKKVYVWPTGPVEKQDSDKRPVEVFEAHSSIVTAALMAPTATRRLLAQSGDPIFDLCNPPPVRLLSRADSVISSQAPTQKSSSDDRQAAGTAEQKLTSPQAVEESPQYLARQSHNAGFIIVTADYTGQIKVFRQDCAFQKRKDNSWDAGSTFSRKMLGRSGSVTTRTSASSSNPQQPANANANAKNHSTDRIINWRDSIVPAKGASSNNSLSETNPRGQIDDRTRSSSPTQASLSHRLSLRHGSMPLASAAARARHSTTDGTTLAEPSNRLATPATTRGPRPGSPKYYSASEHKRSASMSMPSPGPNGPPQFTLNGEPASVTAMTTQAPTPSHEVLDPAQDIARSTTGENPLFLMGETSYLAWDVQKNWMPFINPAPRTPGVLSSGTNPLSREQSYISELSSERVSTGSVSGGEGERSAGGDDTKCRNCGNESFRLVRGEKGPAARFQCSQCGTVVQN